MTINRTNRSGAVVLVTGGSRGIGAGIVRRFAADGASVAFTYCKSPEKASDLVEEIKEQGGTAFAIKADSALPDDLRGAVASVNEKFGLLDVFISSAGILKVGSVDDFSIEDFDQMLDINVRAAFFGIQAASKQMKDGGRVIVIGSNIATRVGFPGASVYSLTKSAIAGMVRGIAIDLAPRRITVNNIQPGPTETDLSSPEARAKIVSLIPLRRVAHPTEVASLAAYLASEDAAFITGASLTMDGGMTV